MLFGNYQSRVSAAPLNNNLLRRRINYQTNFRPSATSSWGSGPSSLLAKARNLWNRWWNPRRQRRRHYGHPSWRRHKRSQESEIRESVPEEEGFPDILEPAFRKIRELDAERGCAKLYACRLAVRAKDQNNKSLKIQERVLLLLLSSQGGATTDSSSSSRAPFEEAARLGSQGSENSCSRKYNKCQN